LPFVITAALTQAGSTRQRVHPVGKNIIKIPCG
jgi:hypothetical protein